MQLLKPDIDLAVYFDKLRLAPRSILMLDYDGTLAPFRAERNEARPYPGVRGALAALVSTASVRLVVVSGRSLADLRGLLGLSPMPELWASHGAERVTPDGRYRLASCGERPAEGLAQAYWWAREKQMLHYTERKPTGIAFHWRGLDHSAASDLRQAVEERWSENSAGYGLELHAFDGGLELRVAGVSKADAVAAVLAEEAADTPCAFLGDDLTDEDAFRALAGRGLSVLVREERRDTAADLWLRPPDELLAFLARWRDPGHGSQ